METRMKRYAPGPWSVLSSDNEDLFIEKHKILTVTSVKTSDVNFQIEVMDASDDTQKADANANLIAAAPELLEALEMIMDKDPASFMTFHEAMAKAEIAIKKAYGETP